MKGLIQLRKIDRWILFILGMLITANGLYTAGPWYLDSTDGQPSPLYLTLFEDRKYVTFFGVLVLISGLWLSFLAIRIGFRNRRVLANVIFTAFLLRFYSLMGVLLTMESWRPPSYLSQAATVVILAVYWYWVQVGEKRNQRTSR